MNFLSFQTWANAQADLLLPFVSFHLLEVHHRASEVGSLWGNSSPSALPGIWLPCSVFCIFALPNGRWTASEISTLSLFLSLPCCSSFFTSSSLQIPAGKKEAWISMFLSSHIFLNIWEPISNPPKGTPHNSHSVPLKGQGRVNKSPLLL